MTMTTRRPSGCTRRATRTTSGSHSSSLMVLMRSASSAALRRRALIGHALGTCRLSRSLSASLSTSAISPALKRTLRPNDGGSTATTSAAAAASSSEAGGGGGGSGGRRPSSSADKEPSVGPTPLPLRRRGPSLPASDASGGGGGGALPFRHSRHKLPLICADPIQLAELTQQVLEAPPGMFRYQDGTNSREDAWDASSAVVQRVEFLLRGHAHTLPGTQWNRWLPPRDAPSSSDDEVDPVGTIATMESLVDRLWEEGHSYMAVRAARMEEVHGPKVENEPSSSSPVTKALSPQTKPPALASELSDDDRSSESSDDDEDSSDEDGVDLDEFFGQAKVGDGDPALSDDDDDDDDDDEDEDEPSYMNDFSLPGPTTHMFDILLDSVACFPTEPRQGYLFLQTIIGRHGLDGGDERNTNPYTRPTVLSYNAPIRLAAGLPYDVSEPSHAQLRDEALQLALGSFDALSHSDLPRNSATYAYLLQAIAKYIPTGTTARGNISLGIFHHARIQGLVDEAVLDAFLSAHQVSNGETFDNWIDKHLGSPARPAKELPHRWRRHSRIRRFHPREATY